MLWGNKAKAREGDKEQQQQQQEVCQYCSVHCIDKPIPVYYKHGLARRYVTICHDCRGGGSETGLPSSVILSIPPVLSDAGPVLLF